jgi:hypothetical protein
MSETEGKCGGDCSYKEEEQVWDPNLQRNRTKVKSCGNSCSNEDPNHSDDCDCGGPHNLKYAHYAD